MAPRNITVERAASLGATRQAQYWIVASARDIATLLHGQVSRAVYQQAVQLLHQDLGESNAAYAARRLQQDDEREDVIPCQCTTRTAINGKEISANGAATSGTTRQRSVAVVARPTQAPRTSRSSRRRGNAS